VLLKKEYDIDIRDPREGRKILVDVATIADYIQAHGKIKE
jgi:acyl carrier protein